MYKQLTLEDRYYIYVQFKSGYSMRKIAKQLNISHTTVSREIKRNIGRKGYRYKQAHAFTLQRHKFKQKSIKLCGECQQIISNCIKMDWSPEQICGWLKVNNIINLHHETIYRYILKDKQQQGLLYKHLRHQGKPYRKRYGYPNNRTGIPNRIDIDLRPKEVNNRLVFGHWEADTIIGKAHKGAIVTIDERVSKLRLSYPINSKHKDKVSSSIIKLLKPIEKHVNSITYDNGKEFAAHEKINQAIACDSYFAKPYHSWERGQNENANGLLRQYFPKSMNLINIAYSQVKIAVDKLNSRPRKCLGFKAPFEVFFEMTGINASQLGVVHL